MAGAAPKPKAETFTCNGLPTTFIVGGRSGFLDGVHYLAHNFVIAGTFDPRAGPAEQTFRDEQWTSGRTGGLQCTASFTETVRRGRGDVHVQRHPDELISPAGERRSPRFGGGFVASPPAAGDRTRDAESLANWCNGSSAPPVGHIARSARRRPEPLLCTLCVPNLGLIAPLLGTA